MTKSDISVMPRYFDRYINLADDIELDTVLRDTADFERLLPIEIAEALGNRVYAPGKWMVKDIVQHLIDTERIMSYRAMRFARNDKTALPGFDENLFADTAHANRRPLADLYAEYAFVRQANVALFQSFDDAMLQHTGVCYNTTISVLALGFLLVGHSIHHANIIRERYLPLLG